MRSLNPKTPLGIYYLGSSELTPIVRSPSPSLVSHCATSPWTATELTRPPIQNPSQSTPLLLSTDTAPARSPLTAPTVPPTLFKPLSMLIRPKSPPFPPPRLRSLPTSWASNLVPPKHSLSEGALSIPSAALVLFLMMVRRRLRHLSTPLVDIKIDDTQESDSAPLRKVHRRATTSWTTPLPQPANPLAGERQERASGLLRRLSLSTSFSRVRCLAENFTTPSDSLRYQPQPGFGNNDQVPAVPPNTALPNSPTNRNSPSNGRNSPPRKPVRRAPSPMGERILKGHFDGFN